MSLAHHEKCGEVRSARVGAADGAWVSLTHYPGEARQPAHAHDFDQISFLVAGSMRERIGKREFELHSPSVGHKPAGLPHEDDWGREGALVFAINVEPGRWGARGVLIDPGWTKLATRFPLSTIVASFFGGPAEPELDAVEDILMLLTPGPLPTAEPPRWLQEVRAALAESSDLGVAEAAAAANVDRAHLTRSFQQHYGIPPSVHRRRALASRAVSAIARGKTSLGGVAHDSGFCDQPHMNRVLRAETGLAPTRLRHLLGRKITSIQDGAPLSS